MCVYNVCYVKSDFIERVLQLVVIMKKGLIISFSQAYKDEIACQSRLCTSAYNFRADSRFAPSQWGTSLQTLQWRNNGRDSISNCRRIDCLLNRLFRRRSKKESKLRVTGLCDGNSPVTGEFPTQRASNAENISIRWRHHEVTPSLIVGWAQNKNKPSMYISSSNKRQCQLQ